MLMVWLVNLAVLGLLLWFVGAVIHSWWIEFTAAHKSIMDARWEPVKPKPDLKLLQTDRFEANTYCGKCGSLSVHAWREPKPYRGNVVRVLAGGTELRTWGGPPNESGFSVVRQCVCGHEWGQK